MTCSIPAWRPMTAAERGLSPVIMATARPMALKAATASGAAGFRVSAMARMPARTPPLATRTIVFPSFCKRSMAGRACWQAGDPPAVEEGQAADHDLLPGQRGLQRLPLPGCRIPGPRERPAAGRRRPGQWPRPGGAANCAPAPRRPRSTSSSVPARAIDVGDLGLARGQGAGLVEDHARSACRPPPGLRRA